MAKKYKTRHKIALMVFSIVATLLSLEAAYRVKFYLGMPRGWHAIKLVHGASPQVYDREFGYHYEPSKELTAVHMSDGRIVSVDTGAINADGNVGSLSKNSQDWQGADLSILVFGDSFTANPYPGITWTDHLPSLVRERTGKRVALLNYGRDGYGIMQMLDLAARAIPEHRPDLVIFAFIGDDLRRARFWRKTVTEPGGGVQHVYVSWEPDGFGVPGASVHALLGFPGVDRAWARRMLSDPRPDDPVLRQVLAKYEQVRKKEHVFFAEFFRRSFLCDRLFRGDAHAAENRTRVRLRVRFDRLEQDRRTSENARNLRSWASGHEHRIMAVHLPTVEDIMSGRYNLDPQQSSLLESLEGLIGRPVIQLLRDDAYRGLDLRSAFLEDGHPTHEGSAVYARSIADALCTLLDDEVGPEGPALPRGKR